MTTRKRRSRRLRQQRRERIAYNKQRRRGAGVPTWDERKKSLLDAGYSRVRRVFSRPVRESWAINLHFKLCRSAATDAGIPITRRAIRERGAWLTRNGYLNTWYSAPRRRHKFGN